MRIALTVVMAIVMFGGTSTAQAHLVTKPKGETLKHRLASQTENLAHAKYVCRRGKGDHKRWSCKAVAWLTSERKETYRKLNPPDIKTYIRTHHPCLADIIEGEPEYGSHGENARYIPTLDYGGGHGNVYEAYGIPQANPGYKMKSAGPDWATNPWTQLRWMIGYVNGRYGGECEARAYKRRYNVY